jgi:small subunit ribosomal protein S9
MATVTSNDILGTGRRKTSVARVRVRPGEGKIKINNRQLEEYFCNIRQRNSVVAPLEQTGKRAQFDVVIRVDGGGITGQADACKLGIARALKKMDEQAAVGLRDSGLLTRDGRMKERKKYGLRGARRGTQFSKR